MFPRSRARIKKTDIWGLLRDLKAEITSRTVVRYSSRVIFTFGDARGIVRSSR